jgi:DNA (cytosine-5)-methyltransferase 1
MGGVVFDEVQADLEAEGYETLPFLLPACAVNAPHRRDRIWIIAYSSNNVHKRGLDNGGHKQKAAASKGENEQQKGWNENGQRVWSEPGSSGENDTNTAGERLEGRRKGREGFGVKAFFKKVDRGYLSEPTLCAGDHGLSFGLDTSALSFNDWRNESIKAAGNAVVPQLVYQIFKAIERYEP